MLKINEIQGSQGWLDARKGCDTASELSAAAGISKYMSRAELMRQKSTGLTKEINDHTQALFNKGHAAEESARAIAERIIGDDLSPMTGMVEVGGLKLLASFDGITFDGEILFEHKLWSESLAEQVRTGILHAHYALQLDQQMLVSSAKKVLFMTSDGTEEKMAWMWYTPELEEFGHVVDIWKQFHADLENYTPPEVIEKPVADVIMGLPAVSIQATGMITESNLPKFKLAAEAFIANIKTELVTDEDFVNAEANVKFCKTAEDDLEGTKKAILAQTTTIDEAIKTIDYIKGQLAAKRLMLDKLVKSEKEARKLAIIDKARIAFNEHFLALEAEIKPIRLIAQHPDFAGAMKGLKKLTAMQDAVDTALRNGKFDADAVAKDVRHKLANLASEQTKDYFFLFPDLQQIIYKPNDDFTLLVMSRIEAHEKSVAAQFEAERVKMQAEADAAAQKRVDEEKRVAEMVLAASKLPDIPKERVGEIMRSLSQTGLSATKTEADNGGAVVTQIPAKELYRPTRIQMIEAVAKEFNMTYSATEQCMREAFAEVEA